MSHFENHRKCSTEIKRAIFFLISRFRSRDIENPTVPNVDKVPEFSEFRRGVEINLQPMVPFGYFYLSRDWVAVLQLHFPVVPKSTNKAAGVPCREVSGLNCPGYF